MSITENAIANRHAEPPVVRRGVPGWFGAMDLGWAARETARLLRDFGVVAASPEVPIRSLSGGNMQKVVLAREIALAPRLLVASHLPVWLHRLLGVLAPTDVIALDTHPEKISRWLDARDVPYSSEAVAAFCARFGANYTDAALILDHRPGATFDAALGWFLKRCRLEHGTIGRHEPVHVLAAGDVDAHYRALP